jgi:hypothetical protein
MNDITAITMILESCHLDLALSALLQKLGGRDTSAVKPGNSIKRCT